MDIQFYHLLSTPLEAALPKLVATAYSRDIRTCIVADEAQIKQLDTALWTYDPASFLPHGIAHDEDASKHPIILSTHPTAVNSATLLIVTNGVQVEHDNNYGFTRLFDMFNGHDDHATADARRRWKQYDNTASPLKYIRQNNDGGWDIVKEQHQPAS